MFLVTKLHGKNKEISYSTKPGAIAKKDYDRFFGSRISVNQNAPKSNKLNLAEIPISSGQITI